MNRLYFTLVVSISTLLMLPLQALLMPTPRVATQQVNSELTPNQLRQLAESIAVKVFAKHSSGSGILIAKQGQVYTVLTNRHVTTPGAPYRIQTVDGKIHPARQLPGTSLKGNDLALLQFRAQGNYAVAKMGVSSHLRENAQVFAAGFPFDSQELVFTTGRISLLPKQALRGGYRIAYTNSMQQGMSGGPLLNRQGEVLGINGLAAYPIFSNAYRFADGSQPTAAQLKQWRRFSWGVPIQTFAQTTALPPQSPTPNRQSLTGVAAKVNNIAAQISVRIDRPGNDNGSGVIIAHQGNTYYVLTAEHVVHEEVQYKVTTPDGRQYPVNSSSVKKMPEVDLALLQFTSDKPYRVATLARYNLDDLGKREGFVFVSGWPASRQGSKVNPSRMLTAGLLSPEDFALAAAKDSFSLTEGYELVYTNITVGGMSGGAVLDTRGRVIGIHGRMDGQSNLLEIGRPIQLGYSLGIPISTFLSLESQLGIAPQLKVETNAPPLLTKPEKDLIRKYLLPIQGISKDSTDAIEWLNYGNQLWRVFKFQEATQALNKAIQLKDNFSEAWYAKGFVLRLQNKYPEAIAAFDKATQIQENFAPAWRWRGNVLLFSNRDSEALASFDKAIALDPKNFSLHNNRCLTLDKLKRYAEARDACSEAIKIKRHPFAYNNRGLAHTGLKDYKQAMADYNQAIRLQSDYADAYLNRGVVHFDLKEYKQAMADYNQAIRLQPDLAFAYNNRGNVHYNLKDYKQALADYNQAIRLQPDYANAYFNRGVFHYNLKEYKQAIADYNQAIRLQPDYADAYLNRGIAHRKLKEYKQAMADYNQAIRLQPDLAAAYYNRGNAHFDLIDYKQAIADYNQAIRLQPDDAAAYYNRGVAHFDLKDYKQAIADYNQVIRLQPDLAAAYYNRGNAHRKLKDYKQVLADYNQVIRLQPNFALAYLIRGVAHGKLKEYKQAMADYNQAIRLQPDDAEAYLNRGLAHTGLKEYKQAMADYNQAIRLQPDFALAYFNRGIAHGKLKEYKQAMADFNQAIRLQPDDAKAYLNRGIAHLYLEDKQGASADLKIAAQLFYEQKDMTSYQLVQDALRKLQH